MSENTQYVVQTTVSPHSVELSRNASGGVSFAVKVYAESAEEASEKAKVIFAKLDTDYPPNRK